MASKRLEVVIAGDSRSLERAFGRASQSGSRFGDRLGRVAKASALALAGAGVGAVGLGAKMVQLAGDAGEVESKFRVVFGREMPKMTKELDRFSDATGASRYQLRQQTADMGALLAPILGNVKAAGEMSVGFTKLATDLSSFNNVPVEETLIAIRAGLVGEAEPLRRFGVLINEAAVKAEAYRLGLAKVGAELSEQQKVQARASLIMKQTTLAQGDATRTADSFTNQLRRLKNQVSDTATDIGMKLVPHVTTALEKLNEWGPMLAQKVQPRLDRLAQWAREHEQEFRDLFADAASTAGALASALEKVAEHAESVAKKMGGWDDAFKLLIGGVLAAKLARVLGILGGKDGSGKGGIVGMMTRLKGLGPVSLVVALSIVDKGFKERIQERARGRFTEQLEEQFGLPERPEEGTRGIGSGVQLGTSQETTHETSGMGGFPAKDWFARAGTPVLAPEDGRVVRHSGRGGTSGQVYGWSIYYQGRATGNLYFITHLMAKRAPIGEYKRGDVLGYVSSWTGGAPHAHVGIKKAAGAITPTPLPTTDTGGTTTGGGAAGMAKTPPLIPPRLREAVARAEGTKGMGDDLTALGAVAAYLQKILPKTKDVEKRIEITEALNQVRSRIKDILEQRAEAREKVDISKQIAWEKLQDRFKQAMDQARERVASARGAFGQAFAAVADKLYQAFDAKTEQLLANARVRIMGFEIGVGEETPAERELRLRREARTDADLQRALASADTAEERQAALDAITERGLEKRAQAERAAADEALAAEQRRIQDERALKRMAFEQELADLEKRWAATNTTAERRTRELQALMKKYEVPFGEVGSLIGKSFASAFLTSLEVVFEALDLLESRMAAAQGLAAGGAGGVNALEALRKRSEEMNRRYGLPVASTSMPPIVIQTVLDGKVVAETVREQDRVYQRSNPGLLPI